MLRERNKLQDAGEDKSKVLNMLTGMRKDMNKNVSIWKDTNTSMYMWKDRNTRTGM
jgi:hypothetical protein